MKICGKNSTCKLLLDLFLEFQLNNREPIIFPEFIFFLKYSLGKYFTSKQSVLNWWIMSMLRL
jgi:Ca2+-binding EF-hand superfamily protein